MKKSILSVGSIAFDTIKTPDGVADKVLGGSLNYFSIASSVFSNVSLVGVVGDDFPVKHLDYLESRGIDVSGIKMVQGNTFHWSGEYQGAMNEAITKATELNVFQTFNPKLSKEQQNAEYLFLANIDPKLQLNVMKQMKKVKLIACDTMNYWISSSLPTLKKVIKQVHILSLNEGECQMLTGKRNPIEGAEEILKMGPKALLLKRGQYGAMLFTKKSKFFIPAFPVKKVIDPTGAGDTFAGGFMGYLAANNVSFTNEKELKKAMIFGTVMASFTVEDFSINRLKKVKLNEAKKRFSDLLKLTSI